MPDPNRNPDDNRPIAYDFGLVNGNEIIHANHSEIGDRKTNSMRVYHSTPEEFSKKLDGDRIGYINFNMEVWCVACDQNKIK